MQSYLLQKLVKVLGRRSMGCVLQKGIFETGWPSKGDTDEAGATPENAKKYNGNLINKLVCGKKGTPMRPNADLNIYVFALFNENMKSSPTSERNYGLFKPDDSSAYYIGFNSTGLLSTSSNTSTTPSSTGSSSSSSSSVPLGSSSSSGSTTSSTAVVVS
nr:glucan endo-1,3-beta-glucosidase 11-like [Coffea arabica]XP_027070681.1 glucan endo-1,3-beta-glucosidase 11-like [Coffea arabica]XP_027081092.1 glucan endo-1,3-beta-glucosidase 11-like [Coffea arabica]XP_027088475.1 glucan endo-1,3-beta-glucosidase 11-like [Coffea arabica]